MTARHPRLLVATACLLASGAAAAQTFPADGAWVPLRCQNRNLFDPAHDAAGVPARDLVGDEGSPAGFVAADAQYLYLRMRLDAAPTMGNNLLPFAWGWAFDTDGNLTDYEALVSVDGQSGQVRVWRNSTTTVPNSPADPADAPALATASVDTRVRTRTATSSFGGNGDTFLDVAVAWSDLATVGITPTTAVAVWEGTSTLPDRLDDDLACSDGTGGVVITLGAAAPPRGALNGTGGGSGGGDGGVTPGQTREVEGGPGCSEVPGGAAGAELLLALLAVAGLVVRRRYTRQG